MLEPGSKAPRNLIRAGLQYRTTGTNYLIPATRPGSLLAAISLHLAVEIEVAGKPFATVFISFLEKPFSN
jgi:hypothetical protein